MGIQVAGSALTVLTGGAGITLRLLTDLLVELAVSILVGIVMGGFTILLTSLIDKMFEQVPESNSFWAEGRGLNLLAIVKATIRIEKTSLDFGVGDIKGLSMAIFGMLLGFLALASSDIPAVVFALSGFGLLLSVWGLTQAMRNDVGDFNILNPFGSFEEAFTIVATGFSITSFARAAVLLCSGG